VTNDLERHGLVDFSLRRAARAAGTTHKVLLYHFGNVDELMRQALLELRDRRIAAAVVAADDINNTMLSERVQFVWRLLTDEDPGGRVLDQASGLALYDPVRYAGLGTDATEQYLPSIKAICPPSWPQNKRDEVAEFILAALRGLLVDLLTSGEHARVNAGLRALLRALENEEATTAFGNDTTSD
jgi:AcrR family transcriptional regulator